MIAALQRVLKKDQVEIRLHSEVDTLLYEDSGEEEQKRYVVCGFLTERKSRRMT